MKFFAVFAAILALTAAAPARSEWSLHEISAALQNPNTDPALIPYLEHALNQIMDALHAGLEVDTAAISLPADIIIPSPAIVEETWTLQEISAALQNPSTNPALIPYLEHALNQIMDALHAGLEVDTATISLPADIIIPSPAIVEETWTLQEISAALQNPSTNPALIPYLEQALNQIMDSLYAGIQVDSVAIAVPADVIVPVPVVVEESAPAPAPAAVPNPLVQIIININKQGEITVVPPPAPSPALVPEVNPSPVVVVEDAFDSIVPTPVMVVDEVAQEIPVNPVDVIEVHPEAVLVPAEVNPIDVIAVGAPEVNPIDIINPIPVNPAGEVGSIIV